MNNQLKWPSIQTALLFSKINPGELTPMLMCLGAYEKKYQKEELIPLEDSGKRIGLVISGSVQMLKGDSKGEQMLFDISRKNDVFGEVYVATEEDTKVTYQALENTRVLMIPYDKVLHTCSMDCIFHRQLVENMVQTLANKNLRLMEKIEVTSKKTLREKIMTYLYIEEKREEGRYIELPMGRMAWAGYLNANRSALTRELKKIKEEGIIDYDRNTFMILRRENNE
jgi:CRP-like cAMP-binding protein